MNYSRRKEYHTVMKMCYSYTQHDESVKCNDESCTQNNA